MINTSPITIDDVTFSTKALSSQKDFAKVSKELIELYNEKYLGKCQ